MMCICIDVSSLFEPAHFRLMMDWLMLLLMFLLALLVMGLSFELLLDSWVIRQIAGFVRGEKRKGKPKRGQDDET